MSEDLHRPSVGAYFMALALVVASRSTCARRAVGCVLVNRHNHVLATGYNGVPRGAPHCLEAAHRCAGARAPSGTGLTGCDAIHAEQNALLQCREPLEVDTVYCTVAPCDGCAKLLLGTAAVRLVYGLEYPGSGVDRWRAADRAAWSATCDPAELAAALEIGSRRPNAGTSFDPVG